MIRFVYKGVVCPNEGCTILEKQTYNKKNDIQLREKGRDKR